MLPVSVVIPTHNRWPMIGEAIESVLNQTFKRFELIVVDDGSTDETLKEVVKFGAKVTLRVQPRRGVAAARNFGVRQAKGEFLSFLDSDDLWKPTKLERQWDYMRTHPEIQICQTEEIWIRNGVRVNPRKRHRKPSGDIFRPSLELCLVSPSSVMMRRSLFAAVGGFDESLTVCEDYDLWLRIAVEHPVTLVREPLVVKRGGHPDQLSRSLWGLDRFRILAIKKLLRSGLRGEKRIWALQALAAKVSVLAQGARKRGRETDAKKYEAVLESLTEETRNDARGDTGLW